MHFRVNVRADVIGGDSIDHCYEPGMVTSEKGDHVGDVDGGDLAKKLVAVAQR